MKQITKTLDNGVVLEFEGNDITIVFPSGEKRYASISSVIEGMYSDLTIDLLPEEIKKEWDQHKKEMEKWKKRISLIRYDEFPEGVSILDPSEVIEEGELIELTPGTYTIGYRNGEYIAEITYRTSIDSYTIETHWFSRKPSIRQIRDAMRLRYLDWLIQKRGLKFTCWECGIETYWWDVIARDIDELVDRVAEQYCGC